MRCEQHSEGGTPAAFGRVRFNATVSAVPGPAALTLFSLGALLIIVARHRTMPGDVVMSGAISKMLRPKAGDTIRAKFARLGAVSIKVVP